MTDQAATILLGRCVPNLETSTHSDNVSAVGGSVAESSKRVFPQCGKC